MNDHSPYGICATTAASRDTGRWTTTDGESLLWIGNRPRRSIAASIAANYALGETFAFTMKVNGSVAKGTPNILATAETMKDGQRLAAAIMLCRAAGLKVSK